MNSIYKNILAGIDVRKNLIDLKALLKNEDNKAALSKLTDGNMDAFMKLLIHEDPKVRKNAANILGVMGCNDAVDVLFDAYDAEDKLFVKADYIDAMAKLDCSDYIQFFKNRLTELRTYEASEEEKKHIKAEMDSISSLLLDREGIQAHTYTGYLRASKVMLVCLPAFMDTLLEELKSRPTVQVIKNTKSAVMANISDINDLLEIRYIREILYCLELPEDCQIRTPENAGHFLRQSDLMEVLIDNHSEGGSFYFRLDVTGISDIRRKSSFAKAASAAIEKAFEGQLVNSSSHYECEIRLAANKAGAFTPFLILKSIPDHRFDYRKYHVAATMRPDMAAGLVALAKPFIKEHAQLLDPFCGVGTLLIERNYALPARSSYGLDTFGEAVKKARANTKKAGMVINYINRDSFTFIHDYRFDEIFTDLPDSEMKREEKDRLYDRFLSKSEELLEDKGRIFVYIRDTSLFKKHLRLSDGYRLMQEFVINEKQGYSFVILEKK